MRGFYTYFCSKAAFFLSITVHNIHKIYGAQKALNDVSFDVKSGEVVGFLGPNGAGKSTMMKIITCFLPQTSGKVTVCGFDVETQSLEVRKVVGYLPEHNPLYLEMYVKEYLEFIAGIHQIKNIRQRVRDMIEATGLSIEQNKKIAALSKGYRQRVGLAQALIHDPEVLILDEPTTGLDPNQIEEIRSLIKEVGKKKTVMLSTHIMQEVEAICDRVIIINQGTIVANDSTKKLQNTSTLQQVIFVEFDGSIDPALLKKIKGVKDIKNLDEYKWHILTESDKDLRKEIFDFAVHHQLSVLSLQKTEQKLEDIFKHFTKNKSA